MRPVRLLWLFVAASLCCAWQAMAQTEPGAIAEGLGIDPLELVKYADVPLVVGVMVLARFIKPWCFSADQETGNRLQRWFERTPDRFTIVPLILGSGFAGLLEWQTPDFTWRVWLTKALIGGVAPAGLFSAGKAFLPTWLSKVLFPDAGQVVKTNTAAVATERKQEAQG